MLSILFLAATALGWDPTEEPTMIPTVLVPLPMTDGVPDGYYKVGNGRCSDGEVGHVSSDFSTVDECARICKERMMCAYFSVWEGNWCIYYTAAEMPVAECGCGAEGDYGFAENEEFETFKLKERWDPTTVMEGTIKWGNVGENTAMSSDGNVIAVVERDAHGSVHVFKMGASGWEPMGAKVQSPDLSEDNFGSAWVTLNSNGNYMAVGSHYAAVSGIGDYTGKAEVFKFDGSTWNRVGDSITGTFRYEYMGHIIALSDDGSILATGSTQTVDVGAVQVYKWDGGKWEKMGSAFTGPNATNQIGDNIAMDGSGHRIVIASEESPDQSYKGQVYVYDWNGSSWEKTWEISGDQGRDYMGAGLSLTPDGKTLAIGSMEADVGSGPNEKSWGTVRVFRESTPGVWTQLGGLMSGKGPMNQFGDQVFISADGSTVIGGARLYNNQQGLVRVFKYIDGEWKQLGNDFEDNSSTQLGEGTMGINADGTKIIIGHHNTRLGALSAAGKAVVYEWKQHENTDVSACTPTPEPVCPPVPEPVCPPVVECPTPAPAPECPTPAPAPECPTPAPAPECPTPAPAPECPTPAPAPECPTPAPAPECPTPAPPMDCSAQDTQITNLQTEMDSIKAELEEAKNKLECMPPSIYNKDTKICTPGYELTCVYKDYGTTYARNAIKTGEAKVIKSSAEECHNWCKDNTEADLFTYKTGNSGCYCKVSDLGFKFFAKEGRTSGAIMNTYSGTLCGPPTLQ